MNKRNILLIPLVAGSVLVATSQMLAADIEPATAAPTPSPTLAEPAEAADPMAPIAATRPETPAAPAPIATPAPPAPVAHIEHVVVPKPPKLMAPPPPPHGATISPDMVEDIDIDEDLGAAVLDEERDLDVKKAVKRYQAEMEKFDRQCQQATDATFRLFESCNKLGQPNIAAAQMDRLQKKLATQQALVATLQKKMAKLDVISPDAPPKRIAHAPVRVKVNPAVEMKHAEPVEDVFIPNEPEHTADAMEPMVDDGEDNDIPAVKRTRDLADVTTLNNARERARIEAKLGADQQAAVRSMQQEMKKLQAEMSALRDMRSSLRISDDAREKLEDARAELELAKVNLRNTQKQYEEARKKRDAVQHGQPEHLPPPADSDIRYNLLREELTNLQLAHTKDNDTNAVAQHRKSFDEAIEKLNRYVKEVYSPAVESAVKFAAEQYENANIQVEENRKRYQSLQREIEKSAAKEGKPVKDKKPAKDVPAPDETVDGLQKY